MSESSEPSIALEIAARDLRAQPFDYAALIRVFRAGLRDPAEPDLAGKQDELVFTGYVERVAPERAGWRVDAAARVHPDKVLLGGTFVKLGHPEQFWSIARIAGLLPEKISINSRDPTWPPPTELWLVMVPVRGVRPKQPIRLGDVVVTEDPKIGVLFGDAPEPLRDKFRSTGVWALVPIRTAMAFDAERAGLERIRHAVERLALLARYAASVTPDGALRPFGMGLVERIEIVELVGSQAPGTERKWLRELSLFPEPVTVDEGFIKGLEAAAQAADRQLDLSVAAWRRATRESDPSVALVALVEALEFYIAGTKGELELFTSTELQRLSERFGSDWSEPQAERLQWLNAKLNEPSYGQRLAKSLERDGVRLSAQEDRALRQIRKLRNDIVHGRTRSLLPPDDHRRAVALIGRILVFRAHALGSQSDG